MRPDDSKLAEHTDAASSPTVENARLRLALAAADSCAWAWDLATRRLRWAANIGTVYERDPSTIGPTFDDYLAQCVHSDDRARLAEAFDRARDEGAAFRLEFCAALPGGRTRWLEHIGRVRAAEDGARLLMGTTLDVEDRKAAEAKLRESEQRLRLLVDSATEYAIFTTDEQRIVTGWNPGAERITGYAEAEILGQSADVVFTPEDRAQRAPEREVERARETGRAANERWHQRKDGTHFYGSGFVEPMRDRSGAIQGFVKIMRDNTDRRRAEAERARLLEREREARAEAEEANRAKDDFLAIASHELRTPLNAILGWSQILRSQISNDTTVAHGLEAIERNALLQRKLIEDILDVSRVTSGKLRLSPLPLDLTAIVAAAVDSVVAEAREKDVRLERSLDASTGRVMGDSDRLQQIVWNLVSNAIKFTPRGGCVHVALAREGSTAVLSVRDTGIGIEPAALGRIFDRFFQANGSSTRRHGGLGLGLSIVRSLVELHGGAVRAESEGAGRGAVFVVTLPLAEPPGADEHAATTQTETDVVQDAGARPLAGIDALVVEDNPDSLGLFCTALERYGASVRGVGSVREAVAEFERVRPDVLISDIGLPTEDGFDLIRDIRARERGGPSTPAVAVTAYAGAEDRLLALRAGFQAHLPKPVDLDQLAATVARLLAPTSSGEA